MAPAGIVDSDRVGIIGHSQGGQTALMMPARDARVKATLSISPSVAHRDTPAAVWQAIKVARAPVMLGPCDGAAERLVQKLTIPVDAWRVRRRTQ